MKYREHITYEEWDTEYEPIKKRIENHEYDHVKEDMDIRYYIFDSENLVIHTHANSTTLGVVNKITMEKMFGYYWQIYV